eukprot:jgi/Mesvir1/12348/Mv00531-RA.1
MGESRSATPRRLPRQKGCSLQSISAAIVIGVCLRIVFRHSSFVATTIVEDHGVDVRFVHNWGPLRGNQISEGLEAAYAFAPLAPAAVPPFNYLSTIAVAAPALPAMTESQPAFTQSAFTESAFPINPQPAALTLPQRISPTITNPPPSQQPVLPFFSQGSLPQAGVPEPLRERPAWASFNPILRPTVTSTATPQATVSPGAAGFAKPAGKEREKKVAMRHLCWTCNVAVQCRTTGVNELPSLQGFPLSYKDYHFNKQNLFLHKKSKLPGGGVDSLAPILPDSGAAVMARYDWSDCALVGNSGSLLRSNYGTRIDGHRLVVRVNQAPTEGYEAHVGAKTTFRLINHMWTQRYAQLPLDLASVPAAKRIPLEPGVTLVASRLGADQQADLEALHRRLSRQTGPSAPSMLVLHRQAIPQARHLVDLYRWCRKEAGKSGSGAVGMHGARPGVVGASDSNGGGVTFSGGNLPTSGMVALFALINACQKVTVYGFGEGGVAGAPYQYYKGLSGRSEGKSLHSFDAESELLDALVKHGAITRCKMAGCNSNPSSN